MIRNVDAELGVVDEQKEVTRMKEEQRNAVEQADEELTRQMRKHAFFKTLSTVVLSFSTLLVLLVIQLFKGDIESLLDNFVDFFIKGSLITIAISNIAGIISNLFVEKRIPNSKEISQITGENWKQHWDSQQKESKFLTGFIALLFVLTLMYSVLVIGGMNNIILVFHIIFYALNIGLIYKFNLFKEQLCPEKYNDLVNELNKAKYNILSGKNIEEDEGVKL